MSSVTELQAWARDRLAGSDQAYEDTQALLCHVLQKDRAWLFAWGDRAVGSQQADRYRELVEQRVAGTPVAHLTGTRHFWNLELEVDPHTLIPRPETELLVEQVLALGRTDESLSLLDLGTGSGAIALAIAGERPNRRITASDASAGALACARRNAERLGIDKVQFVLSDWFSRIEGRFDLVASNPPYIPEQDPHLQQGDLRFEPRSALASGLDGLDDIRTIIAGATRHLQPGGLLMLEHGFDQGSACRALLRESGFTEVRSVCDLAGHERVSRGKAG